MLFIVALISILILSLLQETLVGGSLVLMWVVAMGFSYKDSKALVWSFVAGLVVDVTGGGRLGMRAIEYLLVVAGVRLLADRLPRKNVIVVSALVVGLCVGESLALGRILSVSRLVFSVAAFWIFLWINTWVSERGADRGRLRLKD